MASERLNRLLGGSPVPVLLKFVVLSILVGAVLVYWGLTPAALLRSLRNAFEDVFGFGFDAVKNAFQYFLYGAVIVAPIWLLTRLTARR